MMTKAPARHLVIPAAVVVAALSGAISLSRQVLADPPAGYYDSVDTTSAEAFRQTLHEVIDDHQRFPYSSSSTDTWDILESAEEDPGNPANIIDLYKNVSYVKFGGGTGPYNREHSWPNSYGFPDDNTQNYPYTDCHQLFLCDVSYNGYRENKPFRNCTAACMEWPTVMNNGQGGGSGVYPGNSNWTSGSGTSGTWETWWGRRGDVARAQFYMDVRYEGGFHGITGAPEPDLILTDDEALIAASNTGSNEPIAYMGMLSVLYQWHLEDPVDDFERRRNDVVYSYQGNRNPFVDHPEWVGRLVVTAVQTPVAPVISLAQNYPNPFNPVTTIGFDLEQLGPVHLAVYDLAGARVATLFHRTAPPGWYEVAWDGRDQEGRTLPSGIYVYRLTQGAQTVTRRLALIR